ncbi:L-serine dehydratase [Escovopsis weberi]|uniref:L-serine ammonia-lyase n=1 Tax=Escovopsis weberi TaxID=150374 RepID=A0A0M9VTB9_ESCWE|nr:L-serine dehydratase [Escovopsis weberi]
MTLSSNRKRPWVETPLIKSPSLSKAAGCNVFLKLENTQPSGSFKSRGVGNYMMAKLAALPPDHGPVHFYSSSGGNAGLACVDAAVTLGYRATVVVPLSTSDRMVQRLVLTGAADVQQRGKSWQEADDHLTGTVIPGARARGEAAIYVPPFDAQEIWDGNASIVHEIKRQIGSCTGHYPRSSPSAVEAAAAAAEASPISNIVDAIVCSVGGGGLFCGLMKGLDDLDMKTTRVIAVETEGADSLSQAVEKGELVTLPGITSLATSLGARTVCKKALEYGLRDTVKTAVLSDRKAIRACQQFLDDHKILVELACSVCPALCYLNQLERLVPGLNEESVVVLVICGGSNMTFDMLDKYRALDGNDA